MHLHYWIMTLLSLPAALCKTLLSLVHKILVASRIIVLLKLYKPSHRLHGFGKAKIQTEDQKPDFIDPSKRGGKFRPKPERVLRKVIRYCALNPHGSLRDIRDQFNRSEVLRSGETVSHTYVGRVRHKHAHDIGLLKKEYHNRRPKPVPLHLIWASDLTFCTDNHGNSQPILGLLEHASRACLTLKALPNKTSATLLRTLADVIELLGQKPKFLRTDNEPVFTSRAFRFGLWLVGIIHQTTEVASPWQNGKMERFIYKDVMYAGFAGAKTCFRDTQKQGQRNGISDGGRT